VEGIADRPPDNCRRCLPFAVNVRPPWDGTRFDYAVAHLHCNCTIARYEYFVHIGDVIPRNLTCPDRSFFLFGPRGTGKSTWLRQALGDAPRLDLLDASLFLELTRDPQTPGGQARASGRHRGEAGGEVGHCLGQAAARTLQQPGPSGIVRQRPVAGSVRNRMEPLFHEDGCSPTA
jgi:hypothetical protein